MIEENERGVEKTVVKGDDTGRKMMNMVSRNVEDSLNMMKNQAGTIEEDLSELDVNEAKNELEKVKEKIRMVVRYLSSRTVRRRR